MIQNAAACVRFRIQQNLVRKTEDICIRKDSTLRVEKKRIATGAGNEKPNVVRSQGMYQASAVGTPYCDFAALRQIQIGCTFTQRSVAWRHDEFVVSSW
jgi:hypothetical protein